MKLRHSLLLGSAFLAAATPAHATAYTWNGSATLWSTTTAWNPTVGTTLGSSDDVTFDSTGTASLTNAMGGANQSVKSITFNSASTYTVRLYSSTTTTTTARQLTVGSGGITVTSGNHTILGAKGGSGSTGSLRLASGSFSIADGSSLTFDARVGQSGISSYTKTGAGTLVLNADNSGTSGWSHSGLAVTQGILRFSASGAFGNSGNTYAISSGAALEITGGVSQTISTNVGTITLNGTGIGGNGALRSTSGNNSLNMNAGATGGVVLNTNSSIGVDADTLTINQVVSGSGKNLTKTGAGTLTLGGTNTYSGTTTISAGTLALGATGSIANTSGVNLTAASAKFNVTTANFTLGATQTLGGIGTVENSGRTFTANGILSPGSSPGSLTVDGGTFSLGVGGDYNFQILNAAATAGTGYDTVNLVNEATLDLSSLTASSYSINLLSLLSTGPDVAGNASNFINTQSYSWTLFSTAKAIIGFEAADFAFNTAGFSNALGGGSFSIALADGNTDLVLNFTPVPESRAAFLGGLGMLALLRRRRH